MIDSFGFPEGPTPYEAQDFMLPQPSILEHFQVGSLLGNIMSNALYARSVINEA